MTDVVQQGQELPLPPFEMRQLVGPTDPSFFDNPSGDPILPSLDEATYDAVFDFGCGCGRLARQLIQQRARPRRYVGIDLHRNMVEWAQSNLAPGAPGFEFRHHDVGHAIRNPGKRKPDTSPFPAGDGEFSLVLAHSVFTHLVQAHAEYYLSEVARILADTGVFYATWFLFDKRLYPMMQDFQAALYINDRDPSNAVIFDRDWLVEAAAANGLVLYSVQPPAVRGYHWVTFMTPRREGVTEVDLPEDEAPVSEEGVQASAVEPKV
jgi:SAM-dependent methyltransferase